VVRDRAPRLEVLESASPADALAIALARGPLVVVAGSLYLAGEIRSELS
jgi:hypothetical protein